MKILRTVIIFLIIVFGFVLVFPQLRKIETGAGRELAKEGEFVALDGGLEMRYIEKGEGDPLILIHGFSSSAYSWKDNIDALAEHAHVYAIDLPGFGFSDKPAGFGYTYDDFAQSVGEFMDKMGIQSATLAGSSMGGAVCIRFTGLYAGRVDRLALVGSAGYPHEEGRNPLFAALMTPVVGPFLSSLNNARAMKAILKKTAFRDPAAVTNERAAAYFEPFRVKGARDAMLKTLDNALGTDMSGEIRRIDKKTLLVWGDSDALVPLKYGEAFERDIPDSRLEVFENCGHLPQEERPEEFNKALITFLHETRVDSDR
ncbi:MAG: alpha/beta fold hydrolase [bacterium]